LHQRFHYRPAGEWRALLEDRSRRHDEGSYRGNAPDLIGFGGQKM
jgi:hypothetical protein